MENLEHSEEVDLINVNPDLFTLLKTHKLEVVSIKSTSYLDNRDRTMTKYELSCSLLDADKALIVVDFPKHFRVDRIVFSRQHTGSMIFLTTYKGILKKL